MIGHWEIIVLLLIVVLLFGSGRISSLMGDVAKGIKSFKKGLSDDDTANANAKKHAIEENGDKTNADKTKG